MFGLTMFTPRAGSVGAGSETFVRRATFRDNAWMGEQGWTQDFTTDPPTWTADRPSSPLPGMESPDYFTTEPPDAELMSVGELQRYIAELEPSGFNTAPLKVELHRKLAFPFVTLVMTLLAVPFGISAGRHGALYGIGLGIVIALSYWILISAFVAIGKAGLLTPMLAGWAPNILVARTRRATCSCAPEPDLARASAAARSPAAPQSDRSREFPGGSASRSIRSAICRATGRVPALDLASWAPPR